MILRNHSCRSDNEGRGTRRPDDVQASTLKIAPRTAPARPDNRTELGQPRKKSRVRPKTAEAIAEYRKAVELDPRDALSHHTIILSAQGKTKEADAKEQKAKELYAKHPD